MLTAVTHAEIPNQSSAYNTYVNKGTLESNNVTHLTTSGFIYFRKLEKSIIPNVLTSILSFFFNAVCTYHYQNAMGKCKNNTNLVCKMEIEKARFSFFFRAYFSVK